MFAFVRRDMRYGCENISAMRSGALDAIAVVDTAFSGFMINVEVLEVVVEVDGAGAEVASEESCVGCEDCCDIDMTFAAERDGEACLPLVEMGDDGRV